MAFMIMTAFVVIPFHSNISQVREIENTKILAVQKFLSRMTRVISMIDPGGGGYTPSMAYYATAMTPIDRSKLLSLKLHWYEIEVNSKPLGSLITGYGYINDRYLWTIKYKVYDPSIPNRLLIYDMVTFERDSPYTGESLIRSYGPPPSPDSMIYLEYLITGFYFNNYSGYETHTIEGKEATFNTFLRELKGTESKKPKFFHFAGHGKMKDGKPVILVRDDDDPKNDKELEPKHIKWWLSRNELKDRTRLVYLATCYSLANLNSQGYSSSFKGALIDWGGVQYLIGFKDEVNSVIALLFAERFYRYHLKGGLSVANAFDTAKTNVRNSLSSSSLTINFILSVFSGVGGSVLTNLLLDLSFGEALIVGLVITIIVFGVTTGYSIILVGDLDKIGIVSRDV